LSIMKLLLKHGADVNVRGDDGDTALHKLCRTGQLDSVRIQLKYGADHDIHEAGDGSTALNSISRKTGVEVIRLLLQRGASVNSFDDEGVTPLLKSIRLEKVSLAQLLIRSGADINSRCGQDGLIIHTACYESSVDMVHMLIEQGASTRHLSDGSLGTVFQAACQRTDSMKSDVLAYLLESDLVDVAAESDRWGSNLNAACLMADKDTIRTLIERGAKTNV
ncbi:ankyrin repeat-containing domain protein, partial [Lophiotrema nucula]